MKHDGQHGGAFFYLFLMVAVLGLLTYAVMRMGESQTSPTTKAEQKEQISRLLAQASLIGGALQDMVINGAPIATLATSLDTNTSGNSWDTPPHTYKLYHPSGGGIRYVGQTGTGGALADTTNLADNFQVRKGSYVQGVGDTDSGATPDLLFTSRVSSLAACQLINQMTRATAANAVPPTVADNATFTALFTNTDGTTSGTLENSTPTCANCVGLQQSCVQNTGATAFGYYQVLIPE